MNESVDLSEAVTLYLRRYPGKNDEQFDATYGDQAEAVRVSVRVILDEAMKIQPDWTNLSLNEAGDYVESVMHERHPNLSSEALRSVGNYYTYLMR